MSDFLLELRCEEIPARMQAGARKHLEEAFLGFVGNFGIAPTQIQVWSTPRRLALIARGLPDATQPVRKEAKGPPEGAPDAAIEGFCRKNGVTKDGLELRDVKGRMTWFAVIEKPGMATKDVLAAVIPTIIQSFVWPKSMRWGAASLSTESLRWVRPLSGIVAILGEELVECGIDGISSGYATLGHRFHCPGAITIGSADDYAEKLRACHVIVDHEERAALIREGARKVAADAGLTLVEDEGLVIENAGLTEWPVPLLGRFDEAFLDVPPEVIQLTARVNQKYFVCENKSGKLANAFICTANITAADPAVVVDGNRKVLAARLADARFFWEQDQKKTLAEHAQKLERITFHEKLGTVADKVERVAKLAKWLVQSDIIKPTGVPAQAGTSGEVAPSGTRSQPALGLTQAELATLAEQAARLCKADLVTEMVGEFPELQGLMGGYYARAEGLPDEVSDAIRDHYKPVGQGDEVPTAPVTVAVSLADKLDSVMQFFFVEERPTGSKDPFALRRSAISIVRLYLANGLRGSLFLALAQSLGASVRQASRELDEWSASDEARSLLLAELLTTLEQPRELRKGSSALGLRTHEEVFIGAENVQTLSLRANHVRQFLQQGLRSFGKVNHEAVDFIIDRLKVQQREAGVRHDLIDAVFALGGEDDLVRLLARVHALQAFIGTEDGTNLLAGYKRAANILKKEGWATVRLERSRETHGEGVSTTLDANGIVRTGDEDPLENVDDPQMREIYAELYHTPEPAEAALIDALDAAEPRAIAAIEAEDFAAAMSALASLRAPIDRFFDEVTVNAPQEEVRASRLNLLARFRAAVHKVADFSRIEG